MLKQQITLTLDDIVSTKVDTNLERISDKKDKIDKRHGCHDE